jgi:hypothetical protein
VPAASPLSFLVDAYDVPGVVPVRRDEELERALARRSRSSAAEPASSADPSGTPDIHVTHDRETP